MNTENENLISAKEALAPIRKQMTLGRLFRSARMCEELTQVEMARRLGISPQFLAAIESNKKSVGIGFIVKFTRELGISDALYLEIYFRDQLRKEGLTYEVKVGNPQSKHLQPLLRAAKIIIDRRKRPFGGSLPPPNRGDNELLERQSD